MQALTGLFARQFGTPNYAAHGGFCSVNMAAGMIYTIGGSFWEFGGPDLERAKLFVMIGTAEDHHSNPMKIAISKFKREGGRFIFDQPGAHRLLGDRRRVDPDPARHRRRAVHGAAARADRAADLIDHAFLKRFTNAPQLVVLDDGEREGLFAFDPARPGPPGDGREPHNKLVWDAATGRVLNAYPEGIARAATRRWKATTRSPTAPASRPPSSCCASASASCTPEWAAAITGIPAERIHKLARELGDDRAAIRPSSCRSPGPTPGASEHQTTTGAAGRLPRHARPGRALQRLPDRARAGRPDERAGHHRRARRLSPQGALPAAHRAELPRRSTRRT